MKSKWYWRKCCYIIIEEFYIIVYLPNIKSSSCDIIFETKAVWMTCKGICTRYKAQKPIWEWGRYASGQKRCQICGMFIEWDGLWCPCCGYRLRLKPRSSKCRAKLRQDTSEIHSKGHELHSSQTIFNEFQNWGHYTRFNVVDKTCY
jgi:hypothetical protein